MLTFSNKLFPPKASHKAVLIDNEIWIFGGIIFNGKKKANDLIYYNINEQEFNTVSISTPTSSNSHYNPSTRYDHSMVVYNVSINLKKKNCFYNLFPYSKQSIFKKKQA